MIQYLHSPSKKTISDEDEDTSTTRDTSKGLALTPTTQLYMRALALALSHGNPILLEGVTGAGKTCMIDELARLTNNTGTVSLSVVIDRFQLIIICLSLSLSLSLSLALSLSLSLACRCDQDPFGRSIRCQDSPWFLRVH